VHENFRKFMEMEHILNSIPYTVHVWKKVPPLSVKDQPKGDRIDIPFHLSYAKQNGLDYDMHV